MLGVHVFDFSLMVAYFGSFMVSQGQLNKHSDSLEAFFGEMRMKFDRPYPMPHVYKYLLSIFFFLKNVYPSGPIFLLSLKSSSIANYRVLFPWILHQGASLSFYLQHPPLLSPTMACHLQPHLQAQLRDVVGLIPDHGNKVSHHNLFAGGEFCLQFVKKHICEVQEC